MDIRTASNAEIIEALDIKNEVINRHYKITTCFCETDDIVSDVTIEFISELLYDGFGGMVDEYDYEKKASEILDAIADEVIDKIIEEDRKAEEDYNAREEGRKGNY